MASFGIEILAIWTFFKLYVKVSDKRNIKLCQKFQAK